MRSGFTIVRNGVRLGYPFRESIRSLAPYVDEVVVAVGNSDDGTTEALEALRPALPCELRLIDSPWNSAATKGGFELSRQTNIALDACRHEVCFYLQSDEVLPESDVDTLRADLARFEKDAGVSGLALHWLHFYGDYRHTVSNRRWYRREVRAVKRSSGARSFGDAQGFRLPGTKPGEWKKIPAALSRARVFHYGWVRPAEAMTRKVEEFDKLWHGDAKVREYDSAQVYPRQAGIETFSGLHPAVMQERIARDIPAQFSGPVPGPVDQIRHQAERKFESLFDWRPGEFRNYAIVRRY